MRVAIQIAQSFGVRVHLITLEPSNSSLNIQLRQEVDTRHEIPKTDVLKFLRAEQSQANLPTLSTSAPQPTPDPSQPVASVGMTTSAQSGRTIEEVTKQAIERVLTALPADELATLKTLQTGNGIPTEYDRRILGTSRALLGRDLTSPERTIMRKMVLEWLRQP